MLPMQWGKRRVKIPRRAFLNAYIHESSTPRLNERRKGRERYAERIKMHKMTEIQQHIENLEDPNAFVRCVAAYALGKIGEQAAPAVPALTKALEDPDADVRHGVARALGKIGEQAAPAVSALTKALKDPAADVRRVAAYALGKIGEQAAPAVSALTKAPR